MPTGYQIKDQSALYFLTLQVVQWVDIFTRQRYRDIIIESLSYCRKNKGLEVFAYVIMSNHIHFIVRSKNENLSSIIRDFKRHTSKKIIESITIESESRQEWLLIIFSNAAKLHKRNNKYQFWTHENHAIELTSNEMIEQRFDYIHMNPVKAGLVQNPEEYIYSSARNYAEIDNVMEIDSIDG